MEVLSYKLYCVFIKAQKYVILIYSIELKNVFIWISHMHILSYDFITKICQKNLNFIIILF